MSALRNARYGGAQGVVYRVGAKGATLHPNLWRMLVAILIGLFLVILMASSG